MRRLLLSLPLVALACSGSSPTAPAPPITTTTSIPAANRPPVITSARVTPTFGQAYLTSYHFSAVASDPDGDRLTYTWGTSFPLTGANAEATFFGAGAGSITLTVTDGHGGTATANTPDFVVGTLSGTWQTTSTPINGWIFQLALTQSAVGTVTGSYQDNLAGAGLLDPAEIGRIDALGTYQVRIKIRAGSFSDFYLRGTMQPDGVHLTGALFQSGFTGQPVTLQRVAF